ncbi:lysophospholipid acyltransferase family protein [Thioalkalicoccus limnaeus]|uniref:Lysophospholipid acyltransferase family protein n=1 Tax=Thioalkalicoccus limnaeus TaxID=120681 RepID=A0ABV4BJY0_9GAMM
MLTTLRSLLFLGFLALTVVLYALPLSLTGWFIGKAALGRIGRSWGQLNLWGLRHICGLDYRVSQQQPLPNEACVVLCKHQSAWETIALRAILPVDQGWVLKRELLWIPFFGWALAPYQPIAINRKSGRKAIKQLLEQGKFWLGRERWIIVFPEGTRVAPGQRGRYGLGGALLAERSGVPIVPIAHNAGVFWPRRSIRKHPGVIDVVIGPVIRTEGRSAAELNEAAEEWIEQTVAGLPTAR